MPGTILFLGALLVVIFFELEKKPSSPADFFQLKQLRRSWPAMALLLVSAVFFAFEIYGIVSGALYKNGIPLAGFINFLILVSGLIAYYFMNGRSVIIGTQSAASKILIVGISLVLVVFNIIGVVK